MAFTKKTMFELGAAAALSGTNRIEVGQGAAPSLYTTLALLGAYTFAHDTPRNLSKILNVWHVLAASAVQVPHTGTTSETALATIPIPAGAMGANGALRVLTLSSYPNSANAKITRVRLGGIAGTAFLAASTTTTVGTPNMTFIQNRNSQSSQVGSAVADSKSFVSSATALVTGTIDTSAAQDLVISGQLALDTETMNLERYIVEVFYKA